MHARRAARYAGSAARPVRVLRSSAASQSSHVEQRSSDGPATSRVALGYLAFAAGRAMGRARADALFTRDLGVGGAAAAHSAALRAPLVYESHGYAPEVAARAAGAGCDGLDPASAEAGAAGAPGGAGLARAPRGMSRSQRASRQSCASGSGRARTSPSSPTACGRSRVKATRSRRRPGRIRCRSSAYAGHLYAWKGVDILLDALARLPGVRGLIVGGHERNRIWRGCSRWQRGSVSRTAYVHGACAAIAGRRAAARRRRARAAESGVRNLDAIHLTLEALRIHGRRPSNRRVGSAGDPRGLARRRDRPARDSGAMRRRWPPAIEPRRRPTLRSRERLASAARAAATDYTWDRRAERLETLLSRARRSASMISDRLLTLVRCPECRANITRPPGTAGTFVCSSCARVHRAQRRVPRHAPGRVSSANRRSTSTRRCTPTRGTSGCRRRCSGRGSATTCCADSCAPAPDDLVDRSRVRQRPRAPVESRSRSGRDRHRHQPVLLDGSAGGRGPPARRPAPPALRGRHIHEGVVARRARASLARGAARDAARGGDGS